MIGFTETTTLKSSRTFPLRQRAVEFLRQGVSCSGSVRRVPALLSSNNCELQAPTCVASCFMQPSGRAFPLGAGMNRHVGSSVAMADKQTAAFCSITQHGDTLAAAE